MYGDKVFEVGDQLGFTQALGVARREPDVRVMVWLRPETILRPPISLPSNVVIVAVGAR